MKKVFIILLAIIGFGISVSAQDVITLKNGTDINALVQEIGDVEIKYKKFDIPSGPNYTLKKSEILLIRYENGSKDIFSEEVKQIETKDISITEFKDFTLNRSKQIRVLSLNKTPNGFGLKLQKSLSNKGFKVSYGQIKDGIMPKYTENSYVITLNGLLSFIEFEIIDSKDQRVLFHKRIAWWASKQKVVDKFINNIYPFME